MHELDDIAVMTEYKQGNAAAMSELLRRYKHPVFHFCFRMLGDHHQAQEAAQEVFLRIHVHKGTYDARGKFTTWMFAIAHNICISLVRKRKWLVAWPRHNDDSESLPAGQAGYADLPSNDPSPQAEAHNKEMQIQVRQCIDQLPFLQKEALVLREYHDLSYEEIAAAMKQPVNSVKSLVHRARLEIKAKLLPAVTEAERGPS